MPLLGAMLSPILVFDERLGGTGYAGTFVEREMLLDLDMCSLGVPALVLSGFLLRLEAVWPSFFVECL